MLSFTVPGIPIPQGSKNVFNGRLVEVNGRKLRIWRKTIAVVASAAHKNQAPLDEPLHLIVEFRFSRPKSHFGTGKNSLLLKQNAPMLYKNRPDLDKLVRAVGDALTQAGVIRDDSRITRITASKVYGVSGATITLDKDRLPISNGVSI